MLGGHDGTSSSLSSARAAPVAGFASGPARRPSRDARSIAFQCFAALQAGPLGRLRALARAEVLHQLARVDAQRAGERAGAVGRAGLDAVVLELVEQGLEHR